MNGFFTMIGMAKRAGKVQSGEDIVKKAIRKGDAKLVIIAHDSSDNTKKSIINSCEYYKVKYVEAESMEELGRCIGASFRAVVSINDSNFAKAIQDKYKAD